MDWRGRTATTPSALLAELAARLRDAGVRVGASETIAAQRALLVLDLADPGQVAAGLRACMIGTRAEREVFDRVFGTGVGPADRPDEAEWARAVPVDALASHGGEDEASVTQTGAWSDLHRLRTLDFAAMSEDERRRAALLVERLGSLPPRRRSHRFVGSRTGGRIDLRATLRRCRRFDNEPVELMLRRRKPRPLPINLIVDVSASMQPYAAMLLHYLRASVVAQRAAEAFVFGTEARRITARLRAAPAEDPLAAVRGEAAGWGGGTRIGEALSEINRGLARHFARGGITVIASDGWDRGEPDELAQEMRMLRRRSRAVVWLSPHSGRPGFEPLVRGLRAALPHVDALLAADSVASLERFSASVAALERSSRA